MQEILSISLKDCEYDKKRKVLKLASKHIGMPSQFFVKSHITGLEFRFVSIGPEDKLFDQDGWDGEQQIYRSTHQIDTVDYMVIYHQY